MGQMMSANNAEQGDDVKDLDLGADEDSGDQFEPGEDDGSEVEAGAQEAAKPELDDAIAPDILAELAGDEKPKMVPHKRFNEVNESLKTERAVRLRLEEELARAKGGATAAPTAKAPETPKPYDYDAAEDAYAAALQDGDNAKARQLRAEIRARERADAVAEAEAAADKRYNANRAKDDLSRAESERATAIATAYAAYPFLDINSPDADADAIDEALALTNHYVSKGKSIGDALALATGKVGPRYAPAAAAAPTSKPMPDIEAALKRDSKIPAAPTGLGARASKLDVSKMSSADLKKLSPEDEAMLAGDVL